MDHLRDDDDMARRLHDLVVVVVEHVDHRRAAGGAEADDAALALRPDLRAVPCAAHLREPRRRSAPSPPSCRECGRPADRRSRRNGPRPSPRHSACPDRSRTCCSRRWSCRRSARRRWDWCGALVATIICARCFSSRSACSFGMAQRLELRRPLRAWSGWRWSTRPAGPACRPACVELPGANAGAQAMASASPSRACLMMSSCGAPSARPVSQILRRPAHASAAPPRSAAGREEADQIRARMPPPDALSAAAWRSR